MTSDGEKKKYVQRSGIDALPWNLFLAIFACVIFLPTGVPSLLYYRQASSSGSIRMRESLDLMRLSGFFATVSITLGLGLWGAVGYSINKFVLNNT